MDDRTLLEKAARAAGIELHHWTPAREFVRVREDLDDDGSIWSPLRDDGDALRLAVKLRMTVQVEDYGSSARIEGKPHGAWNSCEAHLHGGIEAATRRAITRAAAAMDKGGDHVGR